MDSTESPPSSFLIVRQLGPDTYIVRMSQDFYGPHGASRIWRALFFSGSTPAREPVRFSILDGDGSILREGLCTVANQGRPITKLNDDRRSSWDKGSRRISDGGSEWTNVTIQHG